MTKEEKEAEKEREKAEIATAEFIRELQEKVEEEKVAIKKVNGISNPSDMMTKYLNREKIDTYMNMIKQS